MNRSLTAAAAAILCLSASLALSASASDLASGIRVMRVMGAAAPAAADRVDTHSSRIRSVGETRPLQISKSGNVTGDNASDPFVIDALPFSDAGTTIGFADDYFEACPFPDAGAPDVVYQFIPAQSGFIGIDLCQSSFDTRVYVYSTSVTPGSPYACNDDYCGAQYFRSNIPSLSVSAGTTYYIVVDGWGDEAGSYSISVNASTECAWPGCSGQAIAESEVCAHSADVTNGGCNTTPQNFGAIDFGSPICGEIWAELPNRDTDWYRKNLTADVAVIWSARAEFPFSLFVFDLSGGCGSLSGLRIDGDPCEDVAIVFAPENTADFAFVVTTREQYGGFPCTGGPWQYEATLDLACACDCNADPFEPGGAPGTCDGVVDVLDVTAVVNSAFRGFAIVPDPNLACPYVRADANCDGFVDILDVTAIVNVAFRGFSPSAVFCNPCPEP